MPPNLDRDLEDLAEDVGCLPCQLVHEISYSYISEYYASNS